MRRFRTVLYLLAAAALAGCQTDGVVSPPVSLAPGQAGITVERPSAAYAIAAKADVTVNGAPFASLGNGETSNSAVQAGPATIAVACSCGTGQRVFRVDLKSGQQYHFLIQPPHDGGGVLGGAVASAAGGALGAAIYNGNRPQPAPFDIVQAP